MDAESAESSSSQDPFTLAQELGLRWDSAPHFPLRPFNAHRQIPFSMAIGSTSLVIEEHETHVLLAVANPLDLATQEQVRWRLGRRVELVVVDKGLLQAAIRRVYEQLGVEQPMVPQGDVEPVHEGEVGELDLIESQEQNPVAQLLGKLFRDAIIQGASDIHLEPRPAGLWIRLRIDGILHSRIYDLKEFDAALIARIKVLAQMDVAQRRLPQDGRIKVVYSRRAIDFRVSSVPVVGGERIVIRILDQGARLLSLEELQMPQKVLEQVRALSRMSEGILIVTGPTGSGKTTTLYSVLSDLPLEQMNAMTIEDPVEYKLHGVNQIGVNPKIGLTFAKGLRHILRQDPDLIMIGEIRDLETAQIAIQSALTGHCVISTLHTPDAVSAMTRLFDMGIEPYLVAASLMGVVGQRLARCICPTCRFSYEPSEEERRHVGGCDRLYRGRGCEGCLGTGYRGRVGLYELVTVGSHLRSLIAAKAPIDAIRSEAERLGLEPLRRAGATLVAQGVTTLEELLRITRSLEE